MLNSLDRAQSVGEVPVRKVKDETYEKRDEKSVQMLGVLVLEGQIQEKSHQQKVRILLFFW